VRVQWRWGCKKEREKRKRLENEPKFFEGFGGVSMDAEFGVGV